MRCKASVSKSAVSRRFVALSSAQLTEWLSRRIDAIDLPVVMIDGIHFRDRVVLVALGFDSQGKKHVLGIREGSTEKTQVVRALLSDLIDRGLDADRTRLWVIDGAKALRRAHHRGLRRQRAGATLPGAQAQQRARASARGDARQRGPGAGRRLGQQQTSSLAKRQLERLANSLAKDHPGAAASLREGLDETLTLIDFGLDEALYRTFRTTNPIENLNGSIAQLHANVKRWRDGQMVLRWIGAALTEASRGFRAVRGYRDMKRLTTALAQCAHGVTAIAARPRSMINSSRHHQLVQHGSGHRPNGTPVINL